MSRFFCSFLLVVLLSGCKSEPETVVKFVYKYQGKIANCQQQDASLMFYLSNFVGAAPIKLKAGDYASETVALLGADCQPSAWQVTLQQEIKSGDTLSFELGVPFTENHGNPLVAQVPLNVSEMFWSWQLGHKFFRFDDANDFSFHLGSTGCKSPSKLRPAKQECDHPNRFTYTVKQFQHNKPIVFDLDKLFIAVDKTKSCMSSQSSEHCQKLFSNLNQSLFYQ